MPPPDDLILGDLRDTTQPFADGSAAMVHADIETGDPAIDADLAHWLPALIARLLAPGGFAVSGATLRHPALRPETLPPTVALGRYHVARRIWRL